MDVTSSDLDLDLFLTQAAWATGVLEDDSLSGMVQWICSQVKAGDELHRFLLHLLRLDAPEQIQAENHLCEVLQITYTSQVPQRVVQDAPGRSVEWGETYMRALTGAPTEFVCRHTETRPDEELTGALLFQARQWRDLLRGSGRSIHNERADRLDEATEMHSGQHTLRHYRPLTPALLHRLRQHGPRSARAAEALTRVFTHQHSRPERVLTIVRDAFSSVSGFWSSDTDARKSAWNNLLEVSILTAITRVAAASPNWTLDSIDTDQTYQAHLTHTDAPLRLTVQKSPPGADAFTSIRKRAGMAKYRDARDSQPDICLTFTHTGTEASVSVLGDAKRNATGDHGGDYLYSSFRTAPYYMSAFADALKLHVDEGEPVGAIRPTFTLFFRQGIEAPHPAREALANGDAENVPPILAFDIEHHLGLKASDPENHSSWSAPILEDWLDCITRQARDRLCGRARR
jgi:hypothetical protein